MHIFILSVILKIDRPCPIIEFVILSLGIRLFSSGFYFSQTLILLGAGKAMGARPSLCVAKIFVVAPPDGLCWVWFTHPALRWFWHPDIGRLGPNE